MQRIKRKDDVAERNIDISGQSPRSPLTHAGRQAWAVRPTAGAHTMTRVAGVAETLGLVDIGTFLNYSEHHLHSHYLVRNADLLSFDQREVAMMAAITLFHRKGRPGPRHATFGGLDRRARSTVRLLSTLLRIAECLDRSHSSAVAHATFLTDGKGRLTLEVTPARDWQLELWRLRDRRRAIEESLRRSLDIREAREPHHSLIHC